LIAEYEDYLNEGLRQNYNNWTHKNDDLVIYRRPLGSVINSLGRNKLLVRGMTEPKTVAKHSGKPVETNIPFKMGLETIKVG
jgi:hypothetical protein